MPTLFRANTNLYAISDEVFLIMRGTYVDSTYLDRWSSMFEDIYRNQGHKWDNGNGMCSFKAYAKIDFQLRVHTGDTVAMQCLVLC